MSRVLLVRPPRIKKAISTAEIMVCEPIGLEIVYALLKHDHQVQILDLMLEKHAFAKTCRDFRPHVVGFTALCIDVLRVLQLAGQAKKILPEVVTMVGGSQTYVDPQSFHHPDMDHVVQYTNSTNVPQLLQLIHLRQEVTAIDGVQSRHLGYRQTSRGKNQLLFPDRQSTRRYRRHYSYFGYQPAAIMQTSLGCSKTCRFCLRWRMEGAAEEDLPLELVLQQIEGIQEPTVMIFDNDFLNNGQRLDDFCLQLERRGVRKNFICYASVDGIVGNQKQLRRFAKNGLRAAVVGYESFSDRELADYKKRATVDHNQLAADILKQAGVDCWASFIAHPDWTAADFARFRAYLRQLNPETTTLVPLTPFAGLPLHKTYRHRLLYPKQSYEAWCFGKVTIRPSRISLRRYYYEILKTNFYVNLWLNSIPYMVKQFGFLNVLKVAAGSCKLLFTYIGLMLRSGEQPAPAQDEPTTMD